MNSAVMRRALKGLVNQDVKLCKWQNLLTETFETIKGNFEGSEDDDLDPESFFYLCLSQSMQKLVKVSSAKLKLKDNKVEQSLVLLKCK